jgi:hypothetical protein
MNPEKPHAKRWHLWACLWGGGVSWLLHFIAIWVCAEFGCISGLGRPGPFGVSIVAWLVLACTVLFLALCGLALRISWSLRQRQGSSEPFVSGCGLALNAIFLLVIAVQSIPVFFHLKNCGSAMG